MSGESSLPFPRKFWDPGKKSYQVKKPVNCFLIQVLPKLYWLPSSKYFRNALSISDHGLKGTVQQILESSLSLHLNYFLDDLISWKFLLEVSYSNETLAFDSALVKENRRIWLELLTGNQFLFALIRLTWDPGVCGFNKVILIELSRVQVFRCNFELMVAKYNLLIDDPDHSILTTILLTLGSPCISVKIHLMAPLWFELFEMVSSDYLFHFKRVTHYPCAYKPNWPLGNLLMVIKAFLSFLRFTYFVIEPNLKGAQKAYGLLLYFPSVNCWNCYKAYFDQILKPKNKLMLEELFLIGYKDQKFESLTSLSHLSISTSMCLRKAVNTRWYNLEKHVVVDGGKKKETKFTVRIHLRICLEGGYYVLDESTDYNSDLRPTAKQLWKQSIGILEVGILNAQGLLPIKTKDGRGIRDAYCVAKYGQKWVRTRTIIDSFTPKWNEQYICKGLPKQCVKYGAAAKYATRKVVGIRIPDDAVC